MLLLALDTSTHQASVALCDENRLYGEHTWHVGNNHSVELLESVQRLFVEGELSMSMLDGLAVALGPGSFNGVRVAVATAKALAFALRKPLVGISTLEIAAAQHQQWPGLVCSLLGAGRTELYAACYLFEGLEIDGTITYTPHLVGDYQMLTPADLASYLQEQITPQLADNAELRGSPYLFCGEISEFSRQALSQHMNGQAFFGESLRSVRHGSILANLAQQRFAEQRLDDPLLLEPLYLRRPSITASTRKQPLLGNQSAQSDRPNDSPSTEREEGALRH